MCILRKYTSAYQVQEANSSAVCIIVLKLPLICQCVFMFFCFSERTYVLSCTTILCMSTQKFNQVQSAGELFPGESCSSSHQCPDTLLSPHPLPGAVILDSMRSYESHAILVRSHSIFVRSHENSVKSHIFQDGGTWEEDAGDIL